MIATTETDKQKLREAGKMLSSILRDVSARATAGISTADLDAYAEKEIRSRGAIPIFLNHENESGGMPYPASLCVSINDEVVHGIPHAQKFIAQGDVVSLDLGLSYEGYVVDAAVTVIISGADERTETLVAGTKEGLHAGIAAAKVGRRLGDIGAAVADVAKKYNLTIVRDLGGHGTGKELHEPPFIANFGTHGKGEQLTEGMVLAIEPIFTLGSGAIKLQRDGWTYASSDHCVAAHFEHTILIGQKGAEILTM